MIIEFPFQYEVRGTMHRRRTTSSSYGIDLTRANVPDVSAADFPVALVLRDELAAYGHTFHHYNGEFWIRDRAAEDEPFGDQHMMLMGRWPSKKHTRPVARGRGSDVFTQREADEENAQCAAGLGAVGLLEFVTAKPHMGYIVDKAGILRSGFRSVDGVVRHKPQKAEDDYKTVEANDMRRRSDIAAHYAVTNVIAVDGELYHRVPEPVAYAGGGKIDWCFSSTIKPLGEHWQSEKGEDRSTLDAYRVSMTELDGLIEANPEIASKSHVKFYVEHIEERFFAKRDMTQLILKDMDTALNYGPSIHQHSTTFIERWCELRDMLEGRMKMPDLIETETLDRAAELLGELDRLSGENHYPGALLWRDRSIEFSGIDAAPETASLHR